MSYLSSYSRAYDKLLDALSWRQQQQYLTHGYFEMVSDLGNRWVINCGQIASNAYRIGRFGYRVYCAVPDMGKTGYCLPDEDMYLAQALMIATDEKAFRKTAVSWPFIDWHLGRP